MVRPPSVDSNGMKKGAWSEEEDNKLRAYIQRYGHWNWRLLPQYAGLARCGKSCRLRWVNYLKPGVRRGNFSKYEEDLILQLHAQLGNKWSAIAARLPGRTDNDVKNFWHTSIEKCRKRNPTAKKIMADQVLQEHKPAEVIPSRTTIKELSVSDAALTKLQNSALHFEDNPSGSTEPQGDFWPDDTFLADPANYNHTQDYYIPPLLEEEFFYSQISNSANSSCLSGLDWIADDDHSIGSSDYVTQPVEGNSWSECFVSNTWNTQSENNYVPHQEVVGFNDPCLEYFDHGMDLFS